MEFLKKYLQQFPDYQSGAYEAALPHVKEVSIHSGEYFLRYGKICKSIAFIEKGLLRLYYLNNAGREVTTCFCRENTITCSYRSLITQQPSDTAIQAIENCKLWVLPYDSLQQLYAAYPFWQQVGRLASENEFVITDCYHRFLHDLTATERYQQILEEETDLMQRVPLNYLASYLQIAPETLSRIRKKMTLSRS